MRGTYVEAQYSTDSAREMIRRWVADHGDRESVARYMRDSLRIGGIKVCRALVEDAMSGVGVRE